MLIYPQLTSGCVAQYPSSKTSRHRSTAVVTRGGAWHTRHDPAGRQAEWTLNYAGLSRQEAQALEQFFQETEGRYRSFLFVDPMTNLLGWTEDWDHPGWEKGANTAIHTGQEDPVGGTGALFLVNGSFGNQGIAQTVAAPGHYIYCLSTWLRASDGANASLVIGGHARTFFLNSEWRRYAFSASPGGEMPRFAVELPAGGSASMFGLQVEAQIGASEYMRNPGIGGVHLDARFDQDDLALIADGPEFYSARVRIVSFRQE